MFNIYIPKKHLDRARNLLTENSAENFYYACLELRFCIESIIYLHVSKIFDEFTPRYINEWAPNKLIKKLLALEPAFEDETQVEIKLSADINDLTTPWLRLGNQKLPTYKWLNKSYNQLGNALHLCQPHITTKNGTSHTKIFNLENIVAKLTELVDSNLILSAMEYQKHKCIICNEETLLSKHYMSNNDHFECDNPQCSALYKITQSGENQYKIIIYDIDDFKCPKCSFINLLPRKDIKVAYKFTCQCGQNYIFKLCLTDHDDT